jgi:AcrR family transcriptional regulator
MSDHTIDSILAAATALFAKRGASGVTVQEIATRAKIASGTIIYHFKSKDNLLFILARDILSSLYRDSKESMLRADHPLQAMHNFIDTFFEVAKTDRNRLLFLARFDPFTQLDLKEFPNADLLLLKNQYIGLISECVGQGMKMNVFNPVDPEKFSLLAWSALRGICHLYSHDADPGDLCPELKNWVTYRLTGSLSGAVS